jgi:hypothetical protein
MSIGVLCAKKRHKRHDCAQALHIPVHLRGGKSIGRPVGDYGRDPGDSRRSQEDTLGDAGEERIRGVWPTWSLVQTHFNQQAAEGVNL